ncbi:unnamed protein product [Mytilus edulis]|uniref:EGF-like domain-containing protein n=1 Tax=Mytilus edulis TaxID=6550 RepID=A0A8S3T650_MYTED|nr:unnamed protein product [Mytilus edulis]
MCICPPDFSGNMCEDPVDLCAGVTCENGGTCIGGTCNKAAGFTELCVKFETPCAQCHGKNGCTLPEYSYWSCQCATGLDGIEIWLLGTETTKSRLSEQFKLSLTYTITPPPAFPTQSLRNGVLLPGNKMASLLTCGESQLSVNESYSWQEYSAAISKLQNNTRILRCINETAFLKTSSWLLLLLKLDSVVNGPGFGSMLDINNKIQTILNEQAMTRSQ